MSGRIVFEPDRTQIPKGDYSDGKELERLLNVTVPLHVQRGELLEAIEALLGWKPRMTIGYAAMRLGVPEYIVRQAWSALLSKGKMINEDTGVEIT